MDKPHQAFTEESLRDIGSCAFALTVVVNFLYVVFGVPAKISAPIFALAIPMVTEFALGAHTALSYLVALLNGCLIFFTAYGMNSASGSIASPRIGMLSRGGRKFFDPWL